MRTAICSKASPAQTSKPTRLNNIDVGQEFPYTVFNLLNIWKVLVSIYVYVAWWRGVMKFGQRFLLWRDPSRYLY